MKTPKKSLQVLAALSATGALASLSGCGGGSLGNQYYNADTGIFYGADQRVGGGIGRNFVDLKNGVPARLGIELTPAALTNLPVMPKDIPAITFIGPVAPKTHGTPFTNDFLFYFTGHEETNEPAHFHLTTLIRSPLQPAPPFTRELMPIAANEFPQGTVRLTNADNPNGVVLPGVGVNVDDPTKPEGKPPLTTIGQNFFFLEGHLNAIVLGPTIDFLKSKQTMQLPIKQPPLYPRAGYFPFAWDVHYDAVRNVHVIELTDFRLADKVIPAGS